MNRSLQLNLEKADITECVIYTRVSSKKQLTEGDGLKSQEKHCRDYAAQHGYKVLAVFAEKAVSGGNSVRPAIEELYLFLEERNGKPIYVVIDDIKRFARDVDIHFDLKVALVQRGGYLQSPGFKFGDEPEDKFIETIMAGAAELERNQNKRQVKSRMLARLEAGYWTFKQPTGYKWAEDPIHKKILVIDPDKLRITKEALEGYANNRFLTKMDVANFLIEQKYFSRPKVPFSTSFMQADRMLNSPLYCGYLAYPEWGVTLRKAHHKGIITFDTYQAIQDKQKGKPVKVMRSDTTRDFLLRNFVVCPLCNRTLTASWSRKKNGKKYGYYQCQKKECPMFAKTIPKAEIEAKFIKILETLEASDLVMDITRTMAEGVWTQKLGERSYSLNKTEEEIKAMAKESENLADKIEKSSSNVLFKVLEKKLVDLEARKEKLEEALAKSKRQRADFGTAFEQARSLIQNPLQTWNDGDIETKRLVVRLVFTKPLCYERGIGYGTTELALPYLISARIAENNTSLVDPTGIGPVTSSMPWMRSTR